MDLGIFFFFSTTSPKTEFLWVALIVLRPGTHFRCSPASASKFWIKGVRHHLQAALGNFVWHKDYFNYALKIKWKILSGCIIFCYII